MIIGNIKNIEVYKGLSKNIDKAIDFIVNLGKTSDGNYEIDGQNVYAMINTISPKGLEGTEILGYERTELCTPQNEYNNDEDYQLYSAQGTLINLKKGDFYIVHPFDAHAPECNKDGKKIRKVIIKIKV